MGLHFSGFYENDAMAGKKSALQVVGICTLLDHKVP